MQRVRPTDPRTRRTVFRYSTVGSIHSMDSYGTLLVAGWPLSATYGTPVCSSNSFSQRLETCGLIGSVTRSVPTSAPAILMTETSPLPTRPLLARLRMPCACRAGRVRVRRLAGRIPTRGACRASFMTAINGSMGEETKAAGVYEVRVEYSTPPLPVVWSHIQPPTSTHGYGGHAEPMRHQ